jgi:hypothetical protein
MTEIDISAPPEAAKTADVRERPRKPRTPLKDVVRKTPRKHRRGIPPPLSIDIDTLPDSAWLNQKETAAVIRRSTATLENWRLTKPDHPLKWAKVAGRLLCQLGSIRALLKGK